MAAPTYDLENQGEQNPYTPGHVWHPNVIPGQGDPTPFQEKDSGLRLVAQPPKSGPEKFSRPQLQALEGESLGDGKPVGQIAIATPVYDEPTGTAPSKPGPDLKAEEGAPPEQAETAQDSSPGSSGPDKTEARAPGQSTDQAPSREQLSEAEQAAPTPQREKQVGRGYVKSLAQPRRFSVTGRIRRRYAIFGGGMVGTIVALIFFLTLSSGPFQFIHIAQLMQRFHFSHQQDAGDARMGRLYRFAREGGKAGETRLGWLGSKMHANMLADLEKIGLKPIYSGADIYQGFEIDRSSPDSPFKDMSNAELKSTLEAKGVDVNKLSFVPVEGQRGLPKATVTVKGYINQRKSLGFLSGQIGDSKVPGALRVRVLARYGLVSWHPMKIIERKQNQALVDLYDKWKKTQEDKLKNGVGEGTVDPTKATREDPVYDKDGKQIGVSDVPDTAPATKDIKGVLDSVKGSKSLKIGGGFATAVGAVCLVKSVNDNIGKIRYRQVIVPLMRMGTDAVTVGNQVMSGQDVSTTEMSFLAKNLTEVGAAGGTISSWDNAESIRAELGEDGGVDIDQPVAGGTQLDQKGVKDSIQDKVPGWISWVNGVPGLRGLCSGLGSAAVGVVGFALGIFSGGVASTAGQTVATSLLLPGLIDKLTHFISGNAINVSARGAQWGNNINYGSRLGANSMSLLFGGVPLTKDQVAVLDTGQSTKSQAEFDSKSNIHKLFSPYDERSVISKLIDGTSPSPTQNIRTIGTSMLHIGSMFSDIPKLFSSKAHAATSYDYGFPEIGFSQDDLNNSSVEDPFANGDAVATAILDKDQAGDGKYIKKAMQCFGVNLKKVVTDENDPTLRWDVIPGDGNSGPYSPAGNPYSSNSGDYPKDCANPSGLDQSDWLKLRFFIFDTGIMEGYACYQDDETSCANNGIDTSSGSSNSGGGNNSDGSSASAQQLAQQIQTNDNIDLNCYSSSVALDIQAAAAGQKGTAGAMTSQAVLQLINALGKDHSVCVTAIQSNGQGHASNSLHYSGDAVDFGSFDGHSLSGRDSSSLQIVELASGLLPKGSRFGQQGCNGAGPLNLPSGFSEIPDSCNHLHIDVPAGTP
jgi:hypothetical protein